MVSNSSGDLVIVFNKWIFVFEVLDLCLVSAAALVEESSVDASCLSHEWPDTIDSLVIEWLLINSSLIHCIEVQDVLWLNFFILINSSLVDEDLLTKSLDLDVPTVVCFGGAHQNRGNHVSGKDVSLVLLNQLNHNWIIEDGLFESLA
jgi:hypothetical protein